jgi:AraC-like DNA-binding protein
MRTARESRVTMAEHEQQAYLRLNFEEVSSTFNLTIAQAAIKLGVSESHLKRQCRILGIDRWPQRKLRALQDGIKQLKPSSTIRRQRMQEKIDKIFRQDSAKVQVVSIKKRGRPPKTGVTLNTFADQLSSFSYNDNLSPYSTDSEYSNSSIESPSQTENKSMLNLDIEEVTALVNMGRCAVETRPIIILLSLQSH